MTPAARARDEVCLIDIDNPYRITALGKSRCHGTAYACGAGSDEYVTHLILAVTIRALLNAPLGSRA
ncbi:MAG: hypothetical protein VYB37_13345 [Pseudomonadota bacterium]|nr:hypothetical protein [Pseudomonadota bacterium]